MQKTENVVMMRATCILYKLYTSSLWIVQTSLIAMRLLLFTLSYSDRAM